MRADLYIKRQQKKLHNRRQRVLAVGDIELFLHLVTSSINSDSGKSTNLEKKIQIVYIYRRNPNGLRACNKSSAAVVDVAFRGLKILQGEAIILVPDHFEGDEYINKDRPFYHPPLRWRQPCCPLGSASASGRFCYGFIIIVARLFTLLHYPESQPACQTVKLQLPLQGCSRARLK